ncbi:UNVERIFIED_CONTAM: cytochrome [Sesamum calycinum]|uniref:Cytochrome n=1 Tax=Sesamum calycinum TaxID=2727403 RepID=A0AAW2R977_9LAMI
MEKLLRKQGLKGNSYRFLFGDARESAKMYDESYAKPIDLNEDHFNRVMPFISKTLRTYGEMSFLWFGPRPCVLITDDELIKTNMVPIMQKSGERILQEWNKLVPNDGSPTVFDIYPYLPDYSATVLANSLFGIPFTESVKRTFHLIRELTFIALHAQPFSIKGEQYVPTKRYRRANAIEKELTETFTNLMYEKLAQRERGEVNVYQCKLFFLAGHETTANLIGWTLLLLSRHQEWQTRAREEALQVIGDKEKITDDELERLKVLVGIHLHRNPKYWGDDALEFKPERFAEGVLKAANGHSAFMPFGGGVRKCLGATMALREAKMFVALFLRSFSFDLSPTYKHGPIVQMNMQPQYGLPLILRKLRV